MQRSCGSAGQPANHSAESSFDKGGSAEQPVTSLGTAEQPLSSSAPHRDVNVFHSIEHSNTGSEMQPSKRCKYDGMMVSSKDVIVPENHLPVFCTDGSALTNSGSADQPADQS